MRIDLKTSHKELSAFSYSSLTDIVLLLLIFFLLTSSFMVTEGLKVNLPSATYTTTTDQKQVTVSLLEDGRMLVDGAETKDADLAGMLRARVTDPAQQVVVLSSDRAVPLERAVFVLDQARGIGASRFFISTFPAKDRDADGPR